MASSDKPSYIDLLNQFWILDAEYQYSHLQIHLYFRLMKINNELGWKTQFKYANSRLEAEIATRPKNLIEARQRLVDSNLISYQQGNTRNAGTYSLFPELLSKGVTKESNSVNKKKVIEGSLNREDKNRKDIPHNPQGEVRDWRNDYSIYLNELRSEYHRLVDDPEFIKKQEKYFPGVDIKLSIEKACVNYWATEAGWKKKKGKKTKNIDWMQTLINAINMNRVFKPREETSKRYDPIIPAIQDDPKKFYKPEKW